MLAGRAVPSAAKKADDAPSPEGSPSGLVRGKLSRQEEAPGDGTLAHAVIGIGINLRHTDFPPDIAAVASTVEDESGTAPERPTLERRLTAAMTAFRPHLPGIIDAYRRRMFLTGMTVTVEKGCETFDAEVLGVTDDGALLIKTRDGQTTPLSSGDVHVHPSKNKSV